MSIIYKHGYFDYFHLADIGWKIGTDDSQTGIFIVHIGELNVSIHLPLNSKEKWNLGLYVLGTCRMYGGDRIVPKTYPQICRESRIDKKKYTQWCFSSYSSMMVSILTSWCLNSLVQCSTICCIWTCIQKRTQFIFWGSPMLDNLQLLYMSMFTQTSAVYFLGASNLCPTLSWTYLR